MGEWSCYFEDPQVIAGSCPAYTASFMSLIGLLISARSDISDSCNRTGKDPRYFPLNESYDFIVVGGGAAGPAVAARLSENPDWSVLLLEAGPEAPTATTLPGFMTNGIGSEVDWKYNTVVQKSACLNTGGICNWPRGKMMSGSQGFQGMMYLRGSHLIYDTWRDDGNPGWGFEDALPFFKKSERNLNFDVVDKEYHGTEGPLAVQFFSDRPKFIDELIKAGIQMGYYPTDLNGKNQTGISIAQMLVYEGIRGSSDRMYLRPNKHRPNLRVAINSHVTKVVIDENNVARGVEFVDKDGNNHTINATKEVILSAGTIGSAQLLLLSGIGPKEDLESVGIQSVQDLPVGKNLHNHVSVGIYYTTNLDNHNLLTTESITEFIKNRTGPLASTGNTQLTGLMKSKYVTDNQPDIQVFFDGFLASCSRSGLLSECNNGTLEGECGTQQLGFRATNIRPKSRGTLKLKSSDPFEYPLLDPNYFAEKEDLDTLVDGLRLVIKLTEQDALKPYDLQLVKTPTPGCENFTFQSDEYLACHIQQATGPEHHQVGTCAMGPTPDKYVVNSNLQVHGVNNLRVMDASVMPLVTNSNPTGAIVMIAEKGSEMIKEKWANKKGSPKKSSS